MLGKSSKPASLALIALALCSSAAAQTAPPESTAGITGSVTNSLTGAPILRTHVLLRTAGGENPDANSSTYGALTNSEGKFTISHLPPGTYNVSADRIGFVMPGKTGAARPLTVTLSPGEKKEDLKLTLTPTGAILGRVFDASGEPMQNVSVQVSGSTAIQVATTDEQGRYRIGGLRPGKYRVHASPQPSPFGAEIRTDGTREVHYSATYYPGTLARASAQRVDVQPADPLIGIDIRLISTPSVSVSGKVSGIPDGAARTFIQAVRRGSVEVGGAPQAAVKADGTFTVSQLDAGKYTFVANSFGKTPQRNVHSAPVEIEVAGTNIEHIELSIVPPFEVAGRMRFDDERARSPQPAPQPSGQPAAAPPPAQVRQIRLDAIAGFMDRAIFAEIGADDSFTLENVQPGQYHVALSWGPGYVRSVSTGPTETEGDLLDVRNGPVGAVMISVSALTCDLSGTVNGPGGPAPGAHVILMSETGGRVQMVDAKPDGTYHATGLAPGKYKVAATDDDLYPMQPGTSMEDDDVISETIELRPGDKLTKDLKKK